MHAVQHTMMPSKGNSLNMVMHNKHGCLSTREPPCSLAYACAPSPRHKAAARPAPSRALEQQCAEEAGHLKHQPRRRHFHQRSLKAAHRGTSPCMVDVKGWLQGCLAFCITSSTCPCCAD